MPLLLVQGRAKFCIYIWKPICAAFITALAAFLATRFQVVAGLTAVFPLVGIVWLLIIWTEHGEAYMTGLASTLTTSSTGRPPSDPISPPSPLFACTATVMLGNLSNGVYCIIFGLMYPYLGAWIGGVVSWVFSLFPSAIPIGMALYWRNKTAEKERDARKAEEAGVDHLEDGHPDEEGEIVGMRSGGRNTTYGATEGGYDGYSGGGGGYGGKGDDGYGGGYGKGGDDGYGGYGKGGDDGYGGYSSGGGKGDGGYGGYSSGGGKGDDGYGGGRGTTPSSSSSFSAPSLSLPFRPVMLIIFVFFGNRRLWWRLWQERLLKARELPMKLQHTDCIYSAGPFKLSHTPHALRQRSSGLFLFLLSLYWSPSSPQHVRLVERGVLLLPLLLVSPFSNERKPINNKPFKREADQGCRGGMVVDLMDGWMKRSEEERTKKKTTKKNLLWAVCG